MSPLARSLACLLAFAGLSVAGRALDAGLAGLAPDGPAALKTWAPPALPMGVRLRRGQRSAVIVRLVVDASGHVKSVRVLGSHDARLDAAAVASAKAWEFTPAVEDGLPTEVSLDAPVIFEAPSRRSGHTPALPPEDQRPRMSPTTPAKPAKIANPAYPAELAPRKLPGVVEFDCHIDATGRLLGYTVASASAAPFVWPALLALRHATFTPASQGDLPVASNLRVEVDFASGTDDAGTLAANGVAGPNGGALPNPAPALLEAPAPVYPYDALMQGEAGEASVNFKVDASGQPVDIQVGTASRLVFGEALAAAVADWRFAAAPATGTFVAVPLSVHWRFAPPGAGGIDTDLVGAAVVADARSNHLGGTGALDRPVRPLYRRMPVAPATQKAAGRAVISAVICRDGGVRLVRIVSASEDDLGWAAAAAFGQWVFYPPMRGGKPADISVELPIDFPAPQ